MSADPNPQEGKRAKLRSISELSIFLRFSSAAALGITFLAQGINAGLAKALDNTGLPTIWNVLVLTAPMTLAVAAVTCIQLLARIVENEKFLVFSIFHPVHFCTCGGYNGYSWFAQWGASSQRIGS
ncbi:MAG: hypothetical protein M3460_21300 [Actinomycetota bacterium]|nr:hypothetical protein [Actinomycetota bacterium]